MSGATKVIHRSTPGAARPGVAQRLELEGASARLLAWWAGSALVFGALLAILDLSGVHTSTLTRDASAVNEVSVHIGLLSTVGFLLWAAAAAVCAVTALVLGRGPHSRYLRWMGALLAFLLLDDVLMLHDELLGEWLGAPEPAVYALYAALVGTFVLVFRRELMAADLLLLLLAAGSLGLSVVLDVVSQVPPAFDDYPKLVGIASLLTYAIRTAMRDLRPLAPSESVRRGDAPGPA